MWLPSVAAELSLQQLDGPSPWGSDGLQVDANLATIDFLSRRNSFQNGAGDQGSAGSRIEGVDERAIAALVSEVEQAWNTHDMSRFAACFAEDADFVNVRGWWWRGRGEIELTHALLHETMFSDSLMELECAATKEVGSGVVVAHVRWRMVGHELGGPEQTSEARTGIWSWVIRDPDGRLEIVSSHNTDTMVVPSSHPLAGRQS